MTTTPTEAQGVTAGGDIKMSRAAFPTTNKTSHKVREVDEPRGGRRVLNRFRIVQMRYTAIFFFSYFCSMLVGISMNWICQSVVTISWIPSDVQVMSEEPKLRDGYNLIMIKHIGIYTIGDPLA